MKKLLIIAYYFPPIQTSGVYRPLRFVKYLREFGWEPIVLTINAVRAHQFDNELLKDIPKKVVIERTPQLDFRRLIDIVKRKGIGDQTVALRDQKRWKMGTDEEKGINSAIKRTLSKIKSQAPVFVKNVFFVPDEEVSWLPVGILSAVKMVKRERVDVMMTTSPPHSAHIVGLLAKRIVKIPWIIDFRDLWVDEFDFFAKPFGRWRKPVEKWMESAVMNHADKIINISQGESRHLQEQYKYLPSEKFRVIHNGFDKNDFRAGKGDRKTKNSKLLNITYVGTLYPSTGDEFFQVLDNLFREKPHLAERFEFRFVGHIAPEYRETFKTCSFRDCLRLDGPLPHKSAVQAMINSDALLLLQGGNKMLAGEIPGKVFEYMASGQPIMAITWPGDVASILQESGLAYVVRPDDPEGIERAIMELIRLKESKALRMKANWSNIEGYEARGLTKKLACILDEMVRGSHP